MSTTVSRLGRQRLYLGCCASAQVSRGRCRGACLPPPEGQHARARRAWWSRLGSDGVTRGLSLHGTVVPMLDVEMLPGHTNAPAVTGGPRRRTLPESPSWSWRMRARTARPCQHEHACSRQVRRARVRDHPARRQARLRPAGAAALSNMNCADLRPVDLWIASRPHAPCSAAAECDVPSSREVLSTEASPSGDGQQASVAQLRRPGNSGSAHHVDARRRDTRAHERLGRR
jgi:hypothetical protein